MTFQYSVHIIELCNPKIRKKNALRKQIQWQIDYFKSKIRVTSFSFTCLNIYRNMQNAEEKFILYEYQTLGINALELPILYID